MCAKTENVNMKTRIILAIRRHSTTNVLFIVTFDKMTKGCEILHTGVMEAQNPIDFTIKFNKSISKSKEQLKVFKTYKLNLINKYTSIFSNYLIYISEINSRVKIKNYPKYYQCIEFKTKRTFYLCLLEDFKILTKRKIITECENSISISFGMMYI